MTRPKHNLSRLHTNSGKSKKILVLTAVVGFLLLCLVLFWLVGRPMLQIVADPGKFRAWVDSFGGLSHAVFICMVALQVFVAFIPGEPLEIGAGYAFGMWGGTLLCLAGTILGSIAVFLLVRTLGMKAVRIFFPQEKIDQLKFLKDTKRRNALMFFVFFVPGSPKDILTYFSGLTNMSLSSFVLITTPARIPSIVTSTIGGDALGIGNLPFAAAVMAGTLAISAVGFMIYNRVCKYHGGNDNGTN
jgi:uncharacterized membrane protein YdjX (TVP38/TMEM64 family)